MRAQETRRKAREFLSTLSGKYQLFIIPIILAILTTSSTYSVAVYTINNETKTGTTDTIPNIIHIISILLLTSASYAVLDTIRLKRNHVSVGDNMIIFSNGLFIPFVLTAVVKWIFLFLWSLIPLIGIFICCFGLASATFEAIGRGPVNWGIVIIGLIVTIIGLILYITKKYAYSMTSYVLYDAIQNGTYSGPRSVIKESSKLMHGHKWRFFCLQFSFIGWYLLTIVTCGFMYFYTLPYMTTANLFFYENLLEKVD